MNQLLSSFFQTSTQKVKYILTSTDRSSKVKRSALFSVAIKGCNILISLILVPLTLGFLNPLEYGIWLTLSSVLLWINYFDIGLGNGLRNKLGEALAKDDFELGRIYVSTTFYMLMLIVVLIFLIFLFAQQWLSWGAILNAKGSITSSFDELVVIVFGFFCLNFLFKFVGNIFLADQKSHINDLLNMLGNLVALVAIFIFMHITKGTLSIVATIFSASPVIVNVVAFPVVFYFYYPKLRPSLSKINLSHFKSLFGLGIQFFFLQVGGMLIFTTSNIIISQTAGPELVTPYNIAFKYFGIISMMFAIIVAPMWSGATNAYAQGNMDWIMSAHKGSLKVWLFSSFVAVALLLISPYVYRFWVGEEVEISYILSFLLFLYVVLVNFSTVYSTFLFGMGKVRIQLINTIIAGVFFVPFAIYLGDIFGLYGIVCSIISVNISGIFLNYIQFNKIIHNRAVGIWNK